MTGVCVCVIALTLTLSLASEACFLKHFFTSFEGNGVIKNYLTRLIRGRKSIRVTQKQLEAYKTDKINMMFYPYNKSKCFV